MTCHDLGPEAIVCKREPGAAADRERHVTERAQAIARAYQSAALNRGLPTTTLDKTAAVMRDLIDVGMIR